VAAPIVLTAKSPVSLSPEKVWAFLADTDRMNRAIDLPSIRFVPLPDRSLTGHYKAETHVMGMLLEYEEYPWDWVEPRYYQMRRRFKSGPIEEIRGGIRMEPTSTGSDLEAWASITPRGWLGKLAARSMGKKAGREIISFVRAFEAHSHGPEDAPSPGRPPQSQVSPDILDTRLGRAGVPGPSERLKRHLLEASDLEVLRMRPFALADQWGEDRTSTLRYFLHAAKAGVMDLAWSVLCPSCRVATSKTKKLSDVKAKAHCETCRIEFGADLAQSVEARFSVNPAVRRARTETYCVGGPANMPDILCQLRLEPGERRKDTLILKPGMLRVRSFQAPGIRELKIGRGSADVLRVRLRAGGLELEPAEVAAGTVALEVENDLSGEALLVIERETWKEQAATAAEVTSLQEFRDLFPLDAVAQGEELAIASLAVLFTDLKGSTDLYQRAGDPRAFTFVQNHFRYLTAVVASCRGGVVKTMGDAIMATFGRARDAVEAAIKMQRGWADFQEERPEGQGILLKVGVHHGSSIAINNGGRLDYFGTTVNMAARVQGQATGGDIVLTSQLADDPEVKEYLIREGLRSEESRAWLKGLSGEQRLLRLRLGG
jgi:adenylate cyclase